MTEYRCPRCNTARFEVLGNLLLADRMLQGEPCHKCGYIFNQPERQVA